MTRVLVLTVLFGILLSPGTRGGESPDSAASIAAGPPAVSEPGPDSLTFRLDLHPSGSSWRPSRPVLGMDLTLASPAWLLPAPETVQLSPFASTLHGADRGAYLGLAVGYLGNLVGLWPEKTVWYLMGAGAALGAGWGAAAGPVSIQVRPDIDDRR